jgi:hypothetical protein
VRDAPTIDRGPAMPISITDKEATRPFAAFALGYSDDAARVLSVTVSLDPAKGGLTAESLSASGFAAADLSGSTFGFSGNADAATQALRLLAFRPVENLAPAGQSTLNILTVTVDDGLGGPAQALSPFISVLSVYDAPTIVPGGPPLTIGDKHTGSPLTGLSIGYPDSAARVLTVEISALGGAGAFTPESLAASGFTAVDGQTWRFTGTAAAASGAAGLLVFKPAENIAPVGGLTSATLAISVSDGVGAPVTANIGLGIVSENDAPGLSGIIASSKVKLNKSVKAFRRMVVGEPDLNDTLTATLKIDKPTKGGFTSASLAAAGFIKSGRGRYRLVGPAASIQVALRKLVYKFTSTIDTSAVQKVKFTVGLTDGSGAAVSNSQTTVSLKV